MVVLQNHKGTRGVDPASFPGNPGGNQHAEFFVKFKQANERVTSFVLLLWMAFCKKSTYQVSSTLLNTLRKSMSQIPCQFLPHIIFKECQ